jgi:hypothetical protein
VVSGPSVSAFGGPDAASDLPIGLVVRDGPNAFEALANADAGSPLGRKATATGPGDAWYGGQPADPGGSVGPGWLID